VTSTAPGAHPLPEEVDALIDPSGGDAQVSAHVAVCDRCQEVRDGLLRVRALLGEQALSVPPEPPDLGARIAAALAAETPLTGPSRTVAPTTVVSLDEHRRGPRRRTLTTWLAAAASVAVIGAGGTFLVSQLGGASDSTAGSAAEAPAPQDAAPEDSSGGDLGTSEERSPATRTATTTSSEPGRSALSASGTDYTRADLAAQAQVLLSEAGTADEQGSQAQQYAVADDASLDACLVALGRPGAEPVATDLARFEGQEAAVVVIPDQGGYDVLVVPPGCGAGDDRVLASARLR